MPGARMAAAAGPPRRPRERADASGPSGTPARIIAGLTGEVNQINRAGKTDRGKRNRPVNRHRMALDRRFCLSVTPHSIKQKTSLALVCITAIATVAGFAAAVIARRPNTAATVEGNAGA